MSQYRLGSLLFAALLTASAGCPKPTVVEATPPPTPEPTSEPASEPVEEPAEEPIVVDVPTRNLEIQDKVIRLKPGIRILFETNSDKLLPESFEILDEVAFVMEKNARLRIRVEGHTDDVGTETYNQDLSARRAASVMKYLLEKGIAEDRLESIGCGEGTPIADNKTEEGKQQNRRVEFVILRRKRPVEPCQVYKPRAPRSQPASAPSADEPAPQPASES